MKDIIKKIISVLPFLFFIFIYIYVFRNWFSNSVIFGGDFPFFYNDYSVFAFPYGWSVLQNFGIGGYTVPFLWGFVSLAFPIYLLKEILPWILIEKVGILFPYLLLSLLFSLYSFSKIFKNKTLAFIASLIFLLNTFILMFVGGGLVITGLSYSLIPIIFVLFKESLNKQRAKDKLILGVLLGLQITFDLRIAFMTGIILLTYFFLNSKKDPFLKDFINTLFIPGILAILINAYWLFPMLIIGRNPISLVGETYTGVKVLDFLSFTRFENAISLLHPNWPENIFGKVSFIKPEFLLLPAIAFSSLLFLKLENKETKKLIIFASFISLLGVFMAKGVNDPFGQVFQFLYKYIPGFQMFRDSSKWFVLIAFGYSLLIPFTVSKIISLNKRLKTLIVITFTFYFFFLLTPALTGQLTKLFSNNNIPTDFYQFKNFVSSQKSYFRTAWFPAYTSVIYGSNTNIAISLNDYLKIYDTKKLIEKINENEKLLQDSSIKYIGVVNDFNHEIFLTDRKYDDKKYQQAIRDLESISWLKKVATFGKIVVFEVPDPKDHFWSPDSNLKVSYKYINPTKYKINVKNAKKGDLLVFSESFDPKWIITSGAFNIQSSKFDNKFNSFTLPSSGNYYLEANYAPQNYVNIGVVITVISFLGFVFMAIYKK